MATLRAIRRQIQSVKNISQITRAMYMVSAAKLRKAQQAVEATRPYAKALDETIGKILIRTEKRDHPLLKLRPEKRARLIVFTSDRGLCGAFNDNLFRATETFIADNKNRLESISLVLVGRKAIDYFKKRPVQVQGNYLNPEREVSFEKAKSIADQIMANYLQEEMDSVYILYPLFHSPLVQRPTIISLLPFQPREKLQIVPVDYEYEPSAKTLLGELLPWQIRIQLFEAMLETRASEHGARMSAMDLATQNAGDMVQRLTLKMNRARQEAITKELLDIVTGTEALKR